MGPPGGGGPPPTIRYLSRSARIRLLTPRTPLEMVRFPVAVNRLAIETARWGSGPGPIQQTVNRRMSTRVPRLISTGPAGSRGRPRVCRGWRVDVPQPGAVDPRRPRRAGEGQRVVEFG